MIDEYGRGDYGLAKTYWLGGLATLGFLVVGMLAIQLAPSDFTIAVGFFFFVVYLVLLCAWGAGTWRAADRYDGLRLWAVLAKVTVVLVWVRELAVGIAIVVFVLI